MCWSGGSGGILGDPGVIQEYQGNVTNSGYGGSTPELETHGGSDSEQTLPDPYQPPIVSQVLVVLAEWPATGKRE